ncbi:hypothetical protein JCM5353_003464 [Sporobolomyces roseus]
MPPQLPNSIVTAIFEQVYVSLCIHPAQIQPDSPIGAKLVFSRFCLVSRLWLSLARPLLVRHFDGQNVELFTQLIQKYNLSSSVKSFYLNPRLIGYLDPTPYEVWPQGMSFLMGYEHRAMREDAMEKVDDIHQELRKKELDRWLPLLWLCVHHLTAMEIGSRRRRKSEVGPYVGAWDMRDGMAFDCCEINTSPAIELAYYLEVLPVCQHITTLRLNLPAEPRYKWDYDDQFSRRISETFPNLQHLTLQMHNDHEFTGRWDEDKSTWSFTSLQSLRILNVPKSYEFSKGILPPFLASAATLRHLEIQSAFGLESGGELFDQHTFPVLETLIIDIPSFPSPRSDFFNRFPNSISVSVPINVVAPLFEATVDLPGSLQHIAFTSLHDRNIDSATRFLQYSSQTGNLPNLRYYVLEGSITVDSWTLEVDSEGNEHQVPSKLVDLIKLCRERGIDLCYEGAVDDGDVECKVELEEPLSEDDNLDFDAEGGEEFRVRWVQEKTREHAISTPILCIAILFRHRD